MSEQTNATRVPMITTARVGFDKVLVQEIVLANKKGKHDLFHVVGQATKATVKPSKDYEDRESIEFAGSFLAVNVKTGEQFKSGKLYLPTVVEAEFAAEVMTAGLVEVALTIYAEYAEKAATSYTYNVKSYGKENNSAFERLAGLIPGMAKMLPSPVAASAKGDAKKK